MKVIHTGEDTLRPAGDNFVGEVRAQLVVRGADGLDIALVQFSAGARTYLHTHETPQVLHCIEGRGILAAGDERNEVGPGDIVYVPAGETHWHGATDEGSFTHLSIRPPGATNWTKIDPLSPQA